MGQKRYAKLIIVVLCCTLFGGLMGVGGTLLGVYVFGQKGTGTTNVMYSGDRSDSSIELVSTDTSKEMTAAEVYAANVKSTVGITTSVKTNYWGYTTTSAASGSGFIITDTGYILTNYHVVEDSTEITVSTYDGDKYTAKLMGYDETNDVAVLKVDADNLTPVVLGDSDKVNVGDEVIAIGNPLGELTFSLTSGAISAKDREITLSDNGTMKLLQTDVAINSGNSGGALFNMYGEVIGITNAKYSSSSSSGSASIDNIGFAIPMNNVTTIINSIINKDTSSKPDTTVIVDEQQQSTYDIREQEQYRQQQQQQYPSSGWRRYSYSW